MEIKQSVFSEQDKKFNKMLVKEGINCNSKLLTSKQMKQLSNRNYDFSSDIIKQFSEKLGISEQN